MLKRLTSDVDTLDAVDLTADVDRSGAQRAAECACGDEVEVLGRLRTVEFGPQTPMRRWSRAVRRQRGGHPDLAWPRAYPGHERAHAAGRAAISVRDGRKVLYHPYYRDLQRPGEATP
jgi:hypothetical protein